MSLTQSHLWGALYIPQQISQNIGCCNQGTWGFRCCKGEDRLADSIRRGYPNCSLHSTLPFASFTLPRSKSSHAISPFQMPASLVQQGCFTSLQIAVCFTALRLGESCPLPDPSALPSSGSSWRLSFHSKGASQGVTVTDNGVLSSSTMKKYLGESSDPRMNLVTTIETYQKSHVVFQRNIKLWKSNCSESKWDPGTKVNTNNYKEGNKTTFNQVLWVQDELFSISRGSHHKISKPLSLPCVLCSTELWQVFVILMALWYVTHCVKRSVSKTIVLKCTLGLWEDYRAYVFIIYLLLKHPVELSTLIILKQNFKKSRHLAPFFYLRNFICGTSGDKLWK